MKKIFENDLTTIIKIEGQIPDDELNNWSAEISSLIKQSKQQVILEMCDVIFISAKAVQVMMNELTDKMFLLNCPTFVKNMLQSAGWSDHVLDS
ncbi:hypothetical protein GWO43_11160 [candidate division KSB1 bacterium]|nr:hypothetical protein [candidate division KSB1 bacterium]NIV69636.1 hypothetical protein [Phycisphaerae bacterium]NIR70375.1 hypothetical protein [candidate division KSB1 bacterium]NIS24499.1 hypothetical protein [candidate division KSB1 bacterium]NIT71427.1 hypothetical protein [candidate division KSB1 bacterium]